VEVQLKNLGPRARLLHFPFAVRGNREFGALFVSMPDYPPLTCERHMIFADSSAWGDAKRAFLSLF